MGLQEQDFAGRSSNDELVIYAPAECEFDEECYQLLADNGKYCVYQYININGKAG